MNKDDDPAPALGIRDALPATARPGHLVVPLSTIRAAGPKISTERASLQKIKSVVSIRESNLGTGDSEQQPENQTSRRGLATRRASARRRGSVHQVALRSVARLARRARMKRNSSSLSAEQQQDDGEGSDPDDSEDEIARANAEHAEIVDNFKIRSLRSAQFFAEQENGGPSQSVGGRKCRLPLISVKSKFRLRWDTVIMFLVVFTSFQVPFDTAFAAFRVDAITTVVDVMFVGDLLLNMRTTYLNFDHVEVTDDREILLRYLWGFFVVDLLSTLPFDSIFSGTTSSLGLLNALKMIRLLRLGRLLKKFDDVTAAGVLRLGRIFLGILLFLHWLACAMKLLVDAEDRTTSWRIWGDLHIDGKTMKDAKNGDALGLYFAFFYSSCAMLFRSIDSHPVTSAERAFVSLVIIFGSMLQAVLFGSVAVLISSFDKSSVDYQDQKVEVLSRLKQLGVPGPITARAKRFLELRWVYQKSSKVDVDHYLSLFSPVLSTEIKLSLYLKRIMDTPFFKDCGREVLISLVNSVNTQVFLPGDAIVRRGEFGDWMCFIGRGSVSVLVPDSVDPSKEREVAVLRDGPGGFFGEMALIFHQKRNATIQARTWTRIHQLYRDAFERVFQKYPDEKRAMDARIDSLKLFKDRKKRDAKPLHAR